MKTRQEKIDDKTIEIYKMLYSQGFSISDIDEIANNLIITGKKAIDNPKNTIAVISNGQLIIEL